MPKSLHIGRRSPRSTRTLFVVESNKRGPLQDAMPVRTTVGSTHPPWGFTHEQSTLIRGLRAGPSRGPRLYRRYSGLSRRAGLSGSTHGPQSSG
jgi:hypothetical protein